MGEAFGFALYISTILSASTLGFLIKYTFRKYTFSKSILSDISFKLILSVIFLKSILSPIFLNSSVLLIF